jgi:hypothetical protein
MTIMFRRLKKLVLMLFQRTGRLDIAAWHALREENLPAYADQEVVEELEPTKPWPKLTPSGVEPAKDEDELLHREHV